MKKVNGPDTWVPTVGGAAAGRDRGTIKSQLAMAGRKVNPITLKRFSWEVKDEHG